MATSSNYLSLGEHPDLTFLLDVIFIVLIFFVVTSNFVNENAIPFTRPTTDESVKPADPALYLYRLLENGTLRYKNVLITDSAFSSTLTRQRALSPDAKFVLEINSKAVLRRVISVIDEFRIVGINHPTIKLAKS